jgi:hypothetical protein
MMPIRPKIDQRFVFRLVGEGGAERSLRRPAVIL